MPISFVPPPLENATYSLGIYEAKSGRLVRRLQEIAPESAFTAGLNGLITNWDGKDDEGKAVAPGRYAARGYAVGALKVDGLDVLGNDWTQDTEDLRIKKVAAIVLVPEDDGLAAVVTLADGGWALLRVSGKDGTLLWKRSLDWASPDNPKALRPPWPWQLTVVKGNVFTSKADATHGYRLSDGTETSESLVGSPGSAPVGKDGTIWLLVPDGLIQVKDEMPPAEEGKVDPEKIALRRLRAEPDAPVFRQVSASPVHDKLYLLESIPGWERVRGLSWLETKEENGKPVSTWQTFFERNIRLPGSLAGQENAGKPVGVDLVENGLSPGKSPRAKLGPGFDGKGSYLSTEDGLRLRQISQRTNLKAAKLSKGKTPGSLTFLQYDGAAWDEFSIEGAKNIMAFDAGEFEMGADGEKTHREKPAEPPDL